MRLSEFTAYGQDFPLDDLQVHMNIRGVGRTAGPHLYKAPVSAASLRRQSLSLHTPSSQSLSGRGGGVLYLAFCFLVRRSKITATNRSRFGWFTLKTEDVPVRALNGRPTLLPEAAAVVQISYVVSSRNASCPLTLSLRSAISAPHAWCFAPVENSWRSAATFKDDIDNRACVTSYQLTSAIKAGAAAVDIALSQCGLYSL